MLTKLGIVELQFAKTFLKTKLFLAKASRWGVVTLLYPYNDMSLAARESKVMRMIFGRYPNGLLIPQRLGRQ